MKTFMDTLSLIAGIIIISQGMYFIMENNGHLALGACEIIVGAINVYFFVSNIKFKSK